MRPSSEGPQETREVSSSAASQGKSRPRARGGWFGKSTDAPASAFDIGERAQAAQLADERDWSRDLKGLDELGTADILGARTSRAYTAGGVVIFGWQQFDAAAVLGREADMSAQHKRVYKLQDAAIGLKAQRDADFVICWADAMAREMGSDELEKYALSLCKAHAHSGTK